MRTLREMLNETTILLQTSVRDWRQAVRLGGKLLVNAGAAKPEYIDAMVRCVEELGPYIVIAPGLAIPHARPEEGALKTCFSLVTLKTPVEFGNPDNDPVNVLFSFSATDKNAHIEALRQMCTLCSDEETFRKIQEAEQMEEILDLLEESKVSNRGRSTE